MTHEKKTERKIRDGKMAERKKNPLSSPPLFFFVLNRVDRG